jgi:hypothetical protein
VLHDADRPSKVPICAAGAMDSATADDTAVVG